MWVFQGLPPLLEDSATSWWRHSRAHWRMTWCSSGPPERLPWSSQQSSGTADRERKRSDYQTITCVPQRPNNNFQCCDFTSSDLNQKKKTPLKDVIFPKNLLLSLRLFFTTTHFWHNIWPQVRLCRLAAFWMVAKRSPCHPDTCRKGSCI